MSLECIATGVIQKKKVDVCVFVTMDEKQRKGVEKHATFFFVVSQKQQQRALHIYTHKVHIDSIYGYYLHRYCRLEKMSINGG